MSLFWHYDAVQASTVWIFKFGLVTCPNGVHLCEEQAISTGDYTPETCASVKGSVQLHNDLKQALWGPENPALPAGSIYHTHKSLMHGSDLLIASWAEESFDVLKFQDKKRLFLIKKKKKVWSFDIL